MRVFHYILRFFLSLKTALWLLGITLILFLSGALIMPGRREFQEIHSIPMLQWLTRERPGITWWLWLLIIALAVISVNTFFCSIESVVRKRGVTQWILLISPQIIHAGFLFILLAHLLTASGGYRSFSVAGEGSLLEMPDGDEILYIKGIDISSDARGYTTDWEVRVEYISHDMSRHADVIRPNKPSIRDDFNVNIKELASAPHKAVLLQVSREPGARYALAGGILITIGIGVLIALKIRLKM